MKEYQSFIYGNAAPQITPKYAPREEQEYLEKAASVIEQKVESKKALTSEFSSKQVAIIAICAIVIVSVISLYLVEACALREQKANVASLKYEYEMLTADNQLVENQINASIDYAYVYEYATQTLGMETPSNHQVITYNRDKTEYVAKRANIPND